MDRIQGDDTADLGGGKRGFRGRNMSAGQRGTEVREAWLNDLQEELVTLIEACGLLPTLGNRSQIRESLRRLFQEQRWTYAVNTGTANGIVAVLGMAPPALVDGLAFSVKMLEANTGPATVALNLLAVKPVKLGGVALEGGEWGPGYIVDFRYDATEGVFQITNIRNGAGLSTGGGTGGGTGGDPGGGTGGGSAVFPKIRLLSMTQVWTKTAGARYAWGLAHGPGGGGAGSTYTGTNAFGDGGGSGGWALTRVALADVTTVLATIPAGGSSSANGDGTNGAGDTSFGTWAIAPPGKGGRRNSTSDPTGSMPGGIGTGDVCGPGNAGLKAAGYAPGAGAPGLLGGAGPAGSIANGRAQGGHGVLGGGGGSSDRDLLPGGNGGPGFVLTVESD